MGYYASGGGGIVFKRILNADEKQSIEDILDGSWYEWEWWNRRGETNSMSLPSLDLWVGGDGKYYFDTNEMLDKIAKSVPILEAGMEFTGEEGDHWRFVFDEKTNSFREEIGRVIYNGENSLNRENCTEFIGQILDGFEDFLCEHGVDIQNDEKTESETPAILYGTHYGELQSMIENTLMEWGLLS